MYKNQYGKMAKFLRDKGGVKVKLSKDDDPQPFGVYLYLNNIPKYGDTLHICRYFDDKKGRLCMGYRMAKGMTFPLYDDCFIPMEAVPRVAQEMLMLAGVSDIKKAPDSDEKKKQMTEYHKRLLGLAD
jgi:hypothetical protein